MILASQLTTRLSEKLHDIGATRWPEDELFRAIDDAQNALLESRSDLFEVTDNVQFQTIGPKQPVPEDCFVVFDITYNLNELMIPVSGITKVDRGLMDRAFREWMIESSDTQIEHWMQAKRERAYYWVYPPVAVDPKTSQPGWVVMRYARRPAVVTAGTDELAIPDEMMNGAYYFAMTRLLEKDEKFAGSAQAQMFLNKFALVVSARTTGEGDKDTMDEEREGTNE